MVKGLQLFLVLAVMLAFFSCKKGKNNDESCNGSSTRREIKLAADDQAMEIDTIPIVASIDSLGGIEIQEVDEDTERLPIEKYVFSVTGKVEKVKKYRDGDWKVKLVDENENYLNCEVPNPGCSYAQNSRFYDRFQSSRDFIEENEKSLEGKTVTIVGVAFKDIDHNYPRNAADNNLELHPILSISF